MAAGDTFLGLRNFIKGKINPNELMSLDKLISDVKVNKDNLAQSKILIEFDNDEDFLKAFGFSDDDAWFYNRINSPYHDYEFHSSDSISDDFYQGYGTNFFSDENKKLMEKISNLISQEEVDFDDYESVGEFFRTLEDLYPREFSSMVGDLTHYRNRSLNASARESVEDDLKSWASRNDYKINSHTTGLYITVADLLEKYVRYNVPHLDLQDLFITINEDKEENYNWSEDIYDYERDEYFEDENFNRDIEMTLEKIISNIEEKLEDENSNFREFLEMVKRIKSKFVVNRTYGLPKEISTTFYITGFDREKNKINLKLIRKDKNKQISVSEENFYHLLYQPTLFDLEDL